MSSQETPSPAKYWADKRSSKIKFDFDYRPGPESKAQPPKGFHATMKPFGMAKNPNNPVVDELWTEVYEMNKSHFYRVPLCEAFIDESKLSQKVRDMLSSPTITHSGPSNLLTARMAFEGFMPCCTWHDHDTKCWRHYPYTALSIQPRQGGGHCHVCYDCMRKLYPNKFLIPSNLLPNFLREMEPSMDPEQEEELAAEKNENEYVMVQNKKLLYEPTSAIKTWNMFRTFNADQLAVLSTLSEHYPKDGKKEMIQYIDKNFDELVQGSREKKFHCTLQDWNSLNLKPWPLAKTFCKNLFRMMVYDALEEPVTPLTKTYYVKVKVKEGREADMAVKIHGEVKNTAMLVAREIYEMSEENKKAVLYYLGLFGNYLRVVFGNPSQQAQICDAWACWNCDLLPMYDGDWHCYKSKAGDNWYCAACGAKYREKTEQQLEDGRTLSSDLPTWLVIRAEPSAKFRKEHMNNGQDGSHYLCYKTRKPRDQFCTYMLNALKLLNAVKYSLRPPEEHCEDENSRVQALVGRIHDMVAADNNSCCVMLDAIGAIAEVHEIVRPSGGQDEYCPEKSKNANLSIHPDRIGTTTTFFNMAPLRQKEIVEDDHDVDEFWWALIDQSLWCWGLYEKHCWDLILKAEITLQGSRRLQFGNIPDLLVAHSSRSGAPCFHMDSIISRHSESFRCYRNKNPLPPTRNAYDEAHRRLYFDAIEECEKIRAGNQ